MTALELKSLNSCSGCPIRHRAICSTCDEREILELERMKYYRTYDPGQTIVFAGDELGFIGSIVTGVIALSENLADGRVQMVGLLMPSDFIGRPGRATAPFTATAATSVTLCCFRRRPFEEMMARTPHVAERMLEKTLDELDAAREWMVILGRKTARERIASLLLVIARRQAELNSDERYRLEFDLPLTREAIADYLGLTIETVSRQFSSMRSEGLIDLAGRRHVKITDLSGLLAETGDGIEGF